MRRLLTLGIALLTLVAPTFFVAAPAHAWGDFTYDTAPWDCDAYFASDTIIAGGAQASTQKIRGSQCSPMFVRWLYTGGGIGGWVQNSTYAVINSGIVGTKVGANHKICNGCTVFTT